MTAVTWAARGFMVTIAAFWAVVGANAARNGIRNIVRAWTRARQVVDAPLAVPCDHCHDRRGKRCQCYVKCGHPKCGAADTRIRAWSPAELAYLRGETNTLPTGTDIPEENPS